MLTSSYEEALVTFRDLCDDCDITDANEYIRGGVELIADLFGRYQIPLDVRKNEVLEDLRRLPMFADWRKIGDQFGISYAPCES